MITTQYIGFITIIHSHAVHSFREVLNVLENFGAMQDNSNDTLQYLEKISQYEYCDII